MKSVPERFCLFAGILLFATPPAFAAEPTNAPATNAAAWNSILQPDIHQPFGIEKRVPWTTSRLVGWPDPPLPYVVKRVFPKLNFKDPVDLANTPALERLFIAELAGKIFSFQTDPEVGQPDLVIDLRRTLPVSTRFME